MPERSLRAIISIAVVIALAWIGAAIFGEVHQTSFRWPFIIIWGILMTAVLAYAVFHALRARGERIDHGTDHGSRLKKGQEPK